ncbi:MAG: SusC/RagA family TonB-linked outer membrane protein [Dysgonamonadaceae bacterium]|nr:SusC/RagA family TonB-linked outer membrane protein [Dysgonamonadaceae bacterium]
MGLFLISLTVPAQSNAKISIRKQNLSIAEALQEVERQSKMSVAYNESKLRKDQSVNLNLIDQPMEKALDEILKNTGFTYQIQGHYIAIVAKGQQPTDNKKITGKVVDENNEPLIGVNISTSNGETGTITDIDGNFSLNIPKGTELIITYIGYKSERLKVGDQNTYNIQLSEDTQTLDEVVVTALGIKRSEKSLSYNAQKVDAEAVSTVKDANFMNSMIGKVAGLNINTSSTGIGGATKVIIRGSKSIEGTNNVLYVIDGVPMNNVSKGAVNEDAGVYSSQPSGSEGIADINPEDIENMTVLTGPAAAALYGSSAANGAIVITTKKGQAGKVKVTVSNQTSFMSPFVMPKFQNTYGNKLGEYQSWGDKLATPSSYNPADFFNTGSNVQNAIAVSWGTDRNQTYVSLASTNAAGIIPNNEYNRYNVSLRNTSSFLNDKMTFDFGINYIVQDNQNMMAQGEYYNPIPAVYTYPRGENFDQVRQYEEYNPGRDIYTQRWQWGDESLTLQNPFWTVYKDLFTTDRSRYMVNANLSYDVLPWLNLAGRVKLDNAVAKEEQKKYAGTMALLAGTNGSYSRNDLIDNSTYADLLVNINKELDYDLFLTANIGSSYYDVRSEETGFSGNLGNEPNLFALRNVDRNDPKWMPLESQVRQQTQSIFANVELGWKSMLYLTLTGRNDWDSSLARMPEKSFFYPSAGLSGIISEMVKLPDFLNYLKVRGSYASVGNPINPQLSIPHYVYDDANKSWATVTYMPISKLYPEKTKSYEIGVDSRFWNKKLSLNITLYKSNTYNQTLTVPVSASSGYSSIIAQTGNIENKGLEVALGFNQKWNDLQWTSSFTASTNRNKVIDLGSYVNTEGETIYLDQIQKTRIGSALIMLTKGGTLGDLWTTSVIKRDENGDIWIDPGTGSMASEDYLQKVGSVLPKWNLGFRNGFSYKGASLDFVIAARLGGKGISYTQAILDDYGVSEASAIARDNGGFVVNNGMVDAETWYKTVGGENGIHSHYVYDATNVRLQEVSLGYTLPSKWLGDVAKTSVSLIGTNLWMIYNKAPYDPESVASTSNYYQGLDFMMAPSLRNIGFKVKFEF